MNPCWKQEGLTEEGAQLADKALLKAIELIILCDKNPTLAGAVLREATFRVVTLATLAPEIRAAYMAQNG